jgi:HEAT repeat protein
MAERIGSPAALEALRQALVHGSPEQRGIAAEALGHGRWPGVREWLLPLLDDPDRLVVLGAIRGLAALGDDLAIARLRVLLCNGDAPLEYRIEIARCLGALDSPQALAALGAGFEAAHDDDLAAVLLDSLGRQDFAATGGVFAELLADPQAGTELQANAADALAGSDAGALPLLAETAARHADAEVRAAAAWALGVNRDTGGYGPQLAAQLAAEPEAEVRRRLYEALVRQQEIPLAPVWTGAAQETDPAARIAAANALAAGLHGPSGTPADATRFDESLVPEMEGTATSPTSLNLRLRAVFALWRAGTPGAIAALYRIRDLEQPKVAAAAQHALAALGQAARP